MAEKITGLTEATSLASDDLLVCVDISDTTMAATGTNKKIQASNLNLPSTGTVVTEEISRIINPGSGEYDFTSLTLTSYDRVFIKGQLRGTVSGEGDWVYCLLNGDTTTSNYHTQAHYAANASESNAEYSTPQSVLVPAATSPANEFGEVEIHIPFPAGTQVKHTRSLISYHRQPSEGVIGWTNCQSSITAAITQITVRTDNHPTDTLSGTLILYGERTL